MGSGFRDALKSAVKQFAFRTDVDALKKKGVGEVSVLGMDRICSLVEEAVHRSLKSRLVGMEREAVADATKAEFLRLMRSNESLLREKSEVQVLKERAEEEIDALRRQLAIDQQALAMKLEGEAVADRIRHASEDAALADRLREALAAGGLKVDAATEERALAVVLESLGRERAAADQAKGALRDREVENLQRRIEKLTQSLSTTEHRLRQVAAMKNIDDGISSIYREVQGLDDGAADVGKKKELMSAIFAANMRLQKRS